jgi:pimeloyl-ACP methyl ester carboxylesterase
MNEEFCRVGNVDLCYETFGEESDPTILLIMGLATQMIAWRDDFCEQLAARGYRVVRFDNRDIGHSTRIAGPTPTTGQLLRRTAKGAPYKLSHMAEDAVGLLDHLGVDKAHVVGASMGGMIGQTLAARAPERVISLTSIMSNTGSRWTGQPAFTVYPMLLRSAPKEREAFVEHIVKTYSAIGSTGVETNEQDLREIAGLSFDRGTDRAGVARQMWAIVASGDRSKELRRIKAPTLVIHGDADKLVRPSGGRATQKAIPGARLVTIEGMGHDLPRALWPRLTGLIADHAAAAESQRVAA